MKNIHMRMSAVTLYWKCIQSVIICPKSELQSVRGTGSALHSMYGHCHCLSIHKISMLQFWGHSSVAYIFDMTEIKLIFVM